MPDQEGLFIAMPQSVVDRAVAAVANQDSFSVVSQNVKNPDNSEMSQMDFLQRQLRLYLKEKIRAYETQQANQALDAAFRTLGA